MWRTFRKESPGLSAKLLFNLPNELKEKAIKLNKEDNFEMIKLDEL